MPRSLSDDLSNPYLFEENAPGEYSYSPNTVGGREASGQLVISEDSERDSAAQRAAGGEFRRGKDHEWGHDDGGHLIGARFGGATGEENLTAQDSNLNRGSYKRMENDWAKHIDNKDKVFVNIETSNGDRPDAYMGYAIFEHQDGSRDYETYSYINESASQQDEWQEEFDEYSAENYLGSAGEDSVYKDMGAEEVQALNASWDEQLVTPSEEIDGQMELG